MIDEQSERIRKGTAKEARELADRCQDHRAALRAGRADPVSMDEFLNRAESVLGYCARELGKNQR